MSRTLYPPIVFEERPDVQTFQGGEVAEHLAPLRENPGEWARVYGPCPAESMAANMWAQGIKNGERVGIEPGEFEASVRTLDDGNKYVWCRFVGARRRNKAR